MESKQFTGDVARTHKEANAFFQTSNSGYGGAKENPTFAKDVPVYSEIGERDLALKHTVKTLKHKILAEMREQGALDTEVYARVKADRAVIKKQDVIPRMYPSSPDKMFYPEPVLNKGNPLYQTSSNLYGKKKPTGVDVPKKYYPKNNQFTGTFLGGNFTDTGLNTVKTPSRVHYNYDA